MFQFTGFPPHPYFIQDAVRKLFLRGFPHSDTCGSMCMCHSPQLFAAYRVFLRLSVPRHPPCALLRLTSPSPEPSVIPAWFFCFFFSFLKDTQSPPDTWSGSAPSILRRFLMSLGFQGSPLLALILSLGIRFSRYGCRFFFLNLPMGLSGLEPPTSRLSGVRSNRLSYKPRLKFYSVLFCSCYYYLFLYSFL